jgi:hypothetical protein
MLSCVQILRDLNPVGASHVGRDRRGERLSCLAHKQNEDERDVTSVNRGTRVLKAVDSPQ